MSLPMATPSNSEELIALPMRPRVPVKVPSDPAIRTFVVVGAILLHVLMGVLFSKVSVLSMVHALAVGVLAFWCAATDRSLMRLALAAAYIAGSEGLWRITGATLIWEYGKYTMAASMIFALVLHGRIKPYWPPMVYLALLIPGTLLTFTMVDLEKARQLVSFDLSGPISLAVSVFFFSKVKLTQRQVAKMLLCYIIPTVMIVALIVLGLAAQEEVVFRKSSLAAASGGFGPNQISAALGLASLCCFLVATNRSVPLLLRIFFGLAILAFASQSALTFSRCGLFYFAGGFLLSTMVMMRNPQMAIQLGLLLAVLAALIYFFVFPWLDAFTGGAMSDRFTSGEMSKRDTIVAMDLKIFQENAFLGIGVGRAKEVRQAMEHRASSHTEYTRLLAEHGFLGVLAIVMLFWMGFIHFWRPRTVEGRALAAGMVAYTLMYMMGNGMRQVLPGLTFGIAACTVLPATSKRARGAGIPKNVTVLTPPDEPTMQGA